MDWQAIISALPQYRNALLLTLVLAITGIIFSIIIGFFCTFFNYFKVPVLSKIADVYVKISRNTPLLIQIFLLYYGLPKIGITLNKNLTGIIGLAFLGGGYMSEAVRGGLSTVSKTQLEIGLAIGLSKQQIFRFVLMPQMFVRSIPDIGANMMFLIKETSVFSAISIMDLTNVTRDLIGMFYLTKEYLLMLVISYAIILLPLALVVNFLERKSRYATFGN